MKEQAKAKAGKATVHVEPLDYDTIKREDWPGWAGVMAEGRRKAKALRRGLAIKDVPRYKVTKQGVTGKVKMSQTEGWPEPTEDEAEDGAGGPKKG